MRRAENIRLFQIFSKKATTGFPHPVSSPALPAIHGIRTISSKLEEAKSASSSPSSHSLYEIQKFTVLRFGIPVATDGHITHVAQVQLDVREPIGVAVAQIEPGIPIDPDRGRSIIVPVAHYRLIPG